MTRSDLVRLRRAKDRMDRDYASRWTCPRSGPGCEVGRPFFAQPRGLWGTPYGYLMTRRIEHAKALRSGRPTAAAIFSRRSASLTNEAPPQTVESYTMSATPSEPKPLRTDGCLASRCRSLRQVSKSGPSPTEGRPATLKVALSSIQLLGADFSGHRG